MNRAAPQAVRWRVNLPDMAGGGESGPVSVVCSEWPGGRDVPGTIRRECASCGVGLSVSPQGMQLVREGAELRCYSCLSAEAPGAHVETTEAVRDAAAAALGVPREQIDKAADFLQRIPLAEHDGTRYE